MSDFKRAMKPLLLREGGYCDVKGDKGGKTNAGITMSVLSRWLGRPASVQEIKDLTVETAEKIYKKWYFDPLALDEVKSDGVAAAAFDQSVNRGPINVARAIQRIVDVEVDGHIGPKSLDAINAFDPAHLVEAIADNAEAVYRSIVRRNPSQQKFLKGWLNRVAELRKFAAWG